MIGTVYIVHAVDTEGPLYESLDATFERIYESFKIRLSPTKKNLRKLRAKEIDLGGAEDVVCDFVREDQIGRYHGTWDQIDRMHETVLSKNWRGKLADSDGEPYVISWHCMDHVGFTNNPRRRAMGFHAVFEHYLQLLRKYDVPRDRIYWHFHPVSFSLAAHRIGRNYSFSNIHNEILARRIIDHRWFPVANRPGGHIETYDINVWLEAWLPFDLANQNMAEDEGLKKLREAFGGLPGGFGDWRGAPTDWRVYHPSLYDCRKEGNLKRWIARCLNINARYSTINHEELRSAFVEASTGRDVLVSVTNHDFRDMQAETESFVKMVLEVAADYPNVRFRWANVMEAFRAVLALPKKPPPQFDITLDERRLRLQTTREIWGVQPFLALYTHEGNYYHDNFIIDGNSQWTYVFDENSIPFKALSHIGFACNNTVGDTVVAVCSTDAPEQWETVLLNTEAWLT